MLIEETFHKLSKMRMHGLAAALEEQVQSKNYDKLSFEERVGLLIDREHSERESRRLTRRLQQAKLRDQRVLRISTIATAAVLIER